MENQKLSNSQIRKLIEMASMVGGIRCKEVTSPLNQSLIDLSLIIESCGFYKLTESGYKLAERYNKTEKIIKRDYP